jgi:hypothetical protein
VLAALLWAGACSAVDVELVAPARPSNPPGCVVMFLPNVRLVDHVAIARANVSCARSRDRCLKILQDQACAVGADAISVVSETSEASYISMTAWLAAPKK